MSAPTSNALASTFDIFNRTRLESTVLEEIFRAAYDVEYASEAKPSAFYPLSVLENIIEYARSDPRPHTLLDVACGHGLPGIFLAQQLKAEKLYGIDVSPGSIALSKENASKARIDAKYWTADIAYTGVDDEACSLVICLDMLLYVKDPVLALHEMSRVLRSNGIFGFTTWTQEGFNERLGVAQISDYRPFLADAGFEILEYDVVKGAEKQQARAVQDLIDREQDLREELGEEAAELWVGMAKGVQKESGGGVERKYVFGVARKK